MATAKKARDYKKEWKTEQARSADELPRRAARARARYAYDSTGRKSERKGKDLAHVNALSRGGSTSLSNVKVETVHKNRAFKRDAQRRPMK